MKNTQLIQHFIDAVFNRGDLNVIQKIIHPNYHYRTPTESMNGTRALTAFVKAFRMSFPDLNIQILDQDSGDRSVFTRIRVTGTHRGEFLGMPPTHQAINVEGCVISKIEDGLILEEWELLDQLTLLQQLGVAS